VSPPGDTVADMGDRARRRRRQLDALVAEAADLGFTVEFVEWCEDAETPGILGYYGGLCNREDRRIKVSTHRHTLEQQVAILSHELEHARGADWASDHAALGFHCGGPGGLVTALAAATRPSAPGELGLAAGDETNRGGAAAHAAWSSALG